jgi:hypothetical protein
MRQAIEVRGDQLQAVAFRRTVEHWMASGFVSPTRPRLIPHHLVIGEHLFDGRAGR